MDTAEPLRSAIRRWRTRRAARASDLAAGLTVGAMLVPQAMAYAHLAGLPPEVGLYASTLPLVLYAMVGTSRQLAVGPVAIVSLLSGTAIAGVADEGTGAAIAAAALLALLVGGLHIVLGVARIGGLVRLLSHPVLIGFTAAAALLIAFSQAGHVLGVSVARSDRFHEVVWNLGHAVEDVHGLTAVVAAAAMVLMVGLRRWLPLVPGALVAVVATTATSVVFDLEGRGVAVVGSIPQGLPQLGVPDGFGMVGRLVPAAIVITLVGFMESIAVGKVYARRDRYEIDPNRELIGLGVANVGSGLIGGYPVTGGFSRTAVNAEAGAKTKLAAVVTATVVLVVIVALTPLLRQLPAATLGAIVIVAVAKLFDLAAMRHIRAIKRADFATLVGAFVATLVLGVELGIAVAVAVSIAFVAARMMTPHTAELGRLPGTRLYRNLDRFGDAEPVLGVAIIRFDVSLSYLNVEFLKRRVRRLIDEAGAGLRAVVFDANGVNDIDSSATEALIDLVDELADRGIEVHLATVKGPVRDVLTRASLDQRLGDRIHEEVHDAVQRLVETNQGPASTDE